MKILVFCIAILLMGCDRFYGPTISNYLQRSLVFEVIYTNGKAMSVVLDSCRPTLIGRPDVGVESIRIRDEAGVVFEVRKDEIDRMLEREDDPSDAGYWAFTGRSFDFKSYISGNCSGG
ncbi:hypothetical protein D3C80_1481550 [compost metagenome]